VEFVVVDADDQIVSRLALSEQGSALKGAPGGFFGR
jgi:hypothetical protein